MERAALFWHAFHYNRAFHGVHDMLCNGKPKPCALGLLHAAAVLPDKRVEYFIFKFRVHAYAIVFYIQMRPDITVSLRGIFLADDHLDFSVFRRKFCCVAQ